MALRDLSISSANTEGPGQLHKARTINLLGPLTYQPSGQSGEVLVLRLSWCFLECDLVVLLEVLQSALLCAWSL